MVELIVDRFGEEAIAAIAAAYREGASDADALEAGTGLPADELYADFYAAFGVEPPQPVAVEPIPPSNVDRPPAGEVDEGGVDPDVEPPAPPPPDDSAPSEDPAAEGFPIGLVLLLAAVAAAAVGAIVLVSRRAARGDLA
jgi:hypothetical protein